MAMISCQDCQKPISSRARWCPACGRPRGVARRVGLTLGIVVGSILLLSLLLSGRPLRGPAPAPSASPRTQSLGAPPHAGIERPSLELRDFQWAPSHGVLYATFTLMNTGPQVWKDAVVRCLAYAPSGTAVGELTTTLYERFEPLAVRDFEGVRVGSIPEATQQVSCQVVRADPA